MKLSILTATYNRANYLPKLYETIKENLKYNLTPEWIIVDDGSTDNTKDIVQGFIEENKVTIKYLYQKNSGKMVAINEAVKISTGDLIVDCDSDDYFTKNSFEIIKKHAEKVLNNDELYGLVFLKSEENGEISGKKFAHEEYKTTMFDLYFKENIGGEKIIVYNSKIRKLYSHQLEHNEKFITEARMYHKMDDKYKLLAINEVIEQGSYFEDGYTKNINKTFIQNPYGYYMYFKELLQKNMKGVILSKRIYVIKHYILFGYLTNKKFNDTIITDRYNKFLYSILYFPGIIKSKKYVVNNRN